VRKCCDSEQIDPEILIAVHVVYVFILPGYEKVIFGILSLYTYVCVSL
jgi:hypothetical protein